MNTRMRFLIIILAVVMCAGCGYTTGMLMPSAYKTIYVEPFKNKIAYGTEQNRNLYIPLLEVNVRNAIVNRFLFDGNLKIADADTASLILKGELTGYEREVLRYTDANDPEEYRIRIIVSLVLWDTAAGEPVWEEPSFVGETTYFTTGSLAKSETTAINDAQVDIARRVVERTIEDW